MDLQIAYARLDVKHNAAAAGITITGIATTPTPDRQNHIFDPLGATFRNPLTLLLNHDQMLPVGSVTLGTPTPEGIPFSAFLPEITVPGALRDRYELVTQSLAAGLYRGVSIGYRVLRNGAQQLANGLLKLTRTEICEVSLVTVPANHEASILSIKALDAPHLAAIGHHPSGVSDVRPRTPNMKNTITERITALESKRSALDARMVELMTKAQDDGTTLDDTAAEEYEGLQAQLGKVDRDLVFARQLEASQLAAAKPVQPIVPGVKAIDLRTNTTVSVKANVPPGTAFARYIMAQVASRGDSYRAIEYAKRWDDSTPEVGLLLKAAVAPGTTTDATWAAPLVPAVRNLAAEFIALLMPATIIGRIPGLRRVPFDVSVPIQTDNGVYNWVGQAAPKPVTKLGFGTAKVERNKIAGIITITDELARSSDPDAETIVRQSMISGISAFMDAQFIDPAVAYLQGVHPGSITNGIAGTPATSDPFADLAALIGKFATAKIPLTSLALIMSETNAFNLSMQLSVTGAPAFPALTAQGGSVFGITVVASQAAGTNVIAVAAPYILIADDGSVTIDVSREASLQLDSAPANPADATTIFTSLWQNNLIGLRAERYCTWKRAVDAAVQLITGAAYAPVAP